MDSKELYLADIWKVVWRYKLTIILTTTVFTAAAIAYALLSTPYYRSTTLLAVVEQEEGAGGLSGLGSQFGSVASLAGVNLSSGGDKNEYLAILGSRQFTESFIEENSLKPKLFSEFWDEASGQWSTESPSDIPTDDDTWELFNTEVRSITEDTETGLVRLSIEWHDRELAAEWANGMVEKANAHLRGRAIEEASKSLSFLYTELEKTNIIGIKQGLYRLIETEIRDQMLANAGEEFAFKVLDPAAVSDADREVRPRRAFVAIIGCFFGFFLGLFIAFLRGFVFSPPTSATPS